MSLKARPQSYDVRACRAVLQGAYFVLFEQVCKSPAPSAPGSINKLKPVVAALASAATSEDAYLERVTAPDVPVYGTQETPGASNESEYTPALTDYIGQVAVPEVAGTSLLIPAVRQTELVGASA